LFLLPFHPSRRSILASFPIFPPATVPSTKAPGSRVLDFPFGFLFYSSSPVLNFGTQPFHSFINTPISHVFLFGEKHRRLPYFCIHLKPTDSSVSTPPVNARDNFFSRFIVLYASHPVSQTGYFPLSRAPVARLSHV